MKISFVVAVYHNEGAISKTHGNINSVFSSELAHHDYEIIFVDDGSKDGSLAEILNLKEQDSQNQGNHVHQKFWPDGCHVGWF